MTMSDNPFWYGYLEAGDKSAPVLRDRRLVTGNPKTLYLYNLKRSAIIEYSREVAEPKLRELKAHESDVIDALNSGYAEARAKFRPRSIGVGTPPEKGGSGRARRREQDEEIQDVGGKTDEGIDELDWGEEAD
jgi:hypothetical protein